MVWQFEADDVAADAHLGHAERRDADGAAVDADARAARPRVDVERSRIDR
jgi:hypothetical protein